MWGGFQGRLQGLQGLEAPCDLLLAQLPEGHLLHIWGRGEWGDSVPQPCHPQSPATLPGPSTLTQVHVGHGTVEHVLAEDVGDENLRGCVQGAGPHPLGHSPQWASIHLGGEGTRGEAQGPALHRDWPD